MGPTKAAILAKNGGSHLRAAYYCLIMSRSMHGAMALEYARMAEWFAEQGGAL